LEPEFVISLVAALLGVAGSATTAGLFEILSRIFGRRQKTKNIEFDTAKLDAAKENINSALSEIQKMADYASNSKEELDKLKNEIDKIKSQKDAIESEVNDIAAIRDLESENIRNVFGIPTKWEKRKDVFFGFVFGIIASIIASFAYAYINDVFLAKELVQPAQ